MEGDLKLAELEIQHICGSFRRVTIKNYKEVVPFIPSIYVTSFSRKKGIIGYVVEGCKVEPKDLIKYLSFVQEIWCGKNEFQLTENKYTCVVGEYKCIVPLMAMSEFLYYCTSVDDTTVQNLLKVLTLSATSKNLERSICRTITSTPHVHSFHTYKAKFFPRFVRSLIVSNLNLKNKENVICDPFVGSGTTLIESSLMGFPSYGIDIDPLSCMISTIKSEALNWTLKDLGYDLDLCNQVVMNDDRIKYTFPIDIHRKFQRWGNLDEEVLYEQQITKELQRISKENGALLKLDSISLSDALTRKFNIRMMGTGSGRFALEIAKKPLQTILEANYKNQIKAIHSLEIIKELYDIEPNTVEVINGDAVKRSFNDDSFDIIVTSPPYLPASSGREDYVIGKLISLKAMGLLDGNSKDSYVTKSIGSMENHKSGKELFLLPYSVRKLYEWLINDPLRKIKAAPIVSYYYSLKESLVQDRRTIKPNGKIIYIIGKESVFYSLSTREILYKVECDKIFKDIAHMVGLNIDKVIDIELDKKNAVARPRSTDKYYECAIVMSPNKR